MSHPMNPVPNAEAIRAAMLQLPPDQHALWKVVSRNDVAPAFPAGGPFYASRAMAIRFAIQGAQTRERIGAIVARYPAGVGITTDDLLNAADTYIQQQRDPAWMTLMCCRVDSFTEALAQCAEMRLLPSLATGDAYFVPRRYLGEWRAAGIAGQPGIEKALMRSGRVATLQSWCVFSQDEFEIAEGGDHDPVIRRPKLGYDANVPNFAVRGVTRLVLTDGRKHIGVKVVSEAERTRFAEDPRFNIETAVKHVAQHSATREVIRTYFFDDPILTRMVDIEDSFWRDAERIEPSMRVVVGAETRGDVTIAKAGTSTVVVRAATEPIAPGATAQTARDRLAAAHARVLAESLSGGTTATDTRGVGRGR